MKSQQKAFSKKIWRSVWAIILVLSFLATMPIYSFAEDTTTTETPKPEIIDMSIALSEDIVVKFYTSELPEGAKLQVLYNETTYEITVADEDGAFLFTKVTPQNLGDKMTATLVASDGTVLDTAEPKSVKDYLEYLIATSYETSGCESEMQYTAMKELAVNMLNYGAAAQTYINHDVENLANADLTAEQKALATKPITVNTTDKAVVGDAWVGAGVRFDYKLGLYFVFEADSADKYTATINGTAVTPEAYPAVAENAYVIRYNGFNATNMNAVVTASLTKEGAGEQTFAYSVKSYVASKGSANNALANLVNAAYVYGYGAVAYDAEYEIETQPDLKNGGKAVMKDAKGYTFDAKYSEVELPALNFTDYTVETQNTGTSSVPVVKTTFTLNNDTVVCSASYESDHCISLNGKLYSQYDIERAELNGATLAYNDTDGYKYSAPADGITLTAPVTSYGAPLTLVGKITMNNGTASWAFYKNTVTLGTATEKAEITVNSTATVSLSLLENSDMFVTEGSSLSVQTQINLGANKTAAANSSSLIIDGTVTAGASVYSGAYRNSNNSYEYGYEPAIYVRNGSLTATYVQTNALQVGSEKEDASGTLTLTGTATLSSKTGCILPSDVATAQTYTFAKGTLIAPASKASVIVMMSDTKTEDTFCGIDIRKGMTIEANNPTSQFIHTDKGAAGNVHRYTVLIEDGAKLNNLGTNFLVSGWKHNTKIFVWKETTISVDGYTYTARVANVTDVGQQKTCTTANLPTVPQVESGTVVTATTTTVNTRLFGTFTQGTLEGGSAIYYQILGEVTN